MVKELIYDTKLTQSGGSTSSVKVVIPSTIRDVLELGKGDMVRWRLKIGEEITCTIEKYNKDEE